MDNGQLLFLVLEHNNFMKKTEGIETRERNKTDFKPAGGKREINI